MRRIIRLWYEVGLGLAMGADVMTIIIRAFIGVATGITFKQNPCHLSASLDFS